MNQKGIIRINRPGTVGWGKEMKSFSITNAPFIGFLMGIVFYSFIKQLGKAYTNSFVHCLKNYEWPEK